MKYKVLLLTAITFITTCLGASAKNILSLKESITDNAIVYPSSFETNTNEMMENWYLKNYAIIDESNIESHDYGLVSDAEYIRRLQALPTTIEMPYNQIVKSYIERYVVRSRTLVAQMLGMCPYYMPIFEEALERHHMPIELKYIPIIESALNPNAVSPAGAGGLWQFMITTAKGVGLTVDSQLDERRDPYRSSEKAAVYFKQLYDTYNDWSLAIAAYNCGPGNVNKAIRRAGTDNPDFWEIYNYLPRETRGYVPAFIAANYVMNYYQKHNINPTLTKKPLIIDTVQVTRRIYLNQISNVLNIPIDEIQILNPQYRANVINGSPARPLTLALPSQQIYSYIINEDKIENYQKGLYAQRGEVQPGETRASDVAGLIDEEGGPEKIIYHTVTEGEDFIDIADRYGMEYDKLKELNDLTSTTLHPGQVLQVINMNSVIEETVMGTKTSTTDEPPLLADRGNNGNNSNGGYGDNNSGRNNGNNGGYRDNNGRNNGEYRDNNSGRTNGGNSDNGRDTRPVPTKPEQPKTQPKEVPTKQNNTPRNDNNNGNTANKTDNKGNNKTDNKGNNKTDNKGNNKTDNKGNNKTDNKGKGNTAKKEDKNPPQPTKHIVKEGDNLTKIATKYGVSQDDLRAANNITGDHIEIGQTLIIPEKGYAKKHPQAQPKQANKNTQQNNNKNNNTQQNTNNKNKNTGTTTQQNTNNKNKNNNTSTQQNTNNKNKNNNTSTQQNNNNKKKNSTQQNNNNKKTNTTTQQNTNNKNNNTSTQQNNNNKKNNTTQQNNNNKKTNTTTQQNNNNNKNKNNNTTTQQNNKNKKKK